ncbi:MAG: hypothetical protein AAF664_09330 [Planctomycetota bacterium]
MPIESTLAKARQAADLGDYGRAREVLSSSLPNYDYDPLLLAALADLALATGDRMDAGRWLLSFIDNPTDQQLESMKLFVDRHRRGGYRGLLSQLPNACRPRKIDESPAYLRGVLESLNAPRILQLDRATRAKGNSFEFVVVACGFGIAFLTLIVCFVVGFITTINWLLE